MSDPQLPAEVRAAIDALGVPYAVMACDPELADTAAFCEHYGVPLENAGNTIVVETKKKPRRYAACVVMATTRLDANRTVRALMGDKVSFASAEVTRAQTGQMIGGVTPFALADMPVYVDARIRDLDYVVLGGGDRKTKIRVGPEVFERHPHAEFVDGLAMLREG